MHYVGIDLGTTNSAICSFDGEQVHVYKSPDQHRRLSILIGAAAITGAEHTMQVPVHLTMSLCSSSV